MKYLFLLGFFSLFSLSVLAQSKEVTAVAKAVERLRVAMIDADKPVLEEMVSDSLSYGHSTGRIENKDLFVGNIVSGKSDFVTIQLLEQTISVVHNNAIVRHILDATTNDSGKPGTVKLKILLVWTKEKGKWILLARQAVKIP
ncbi:MAG: nuclear transport factor 2 family protein [Bacteroidota bacterium]|nr:nuclear transport factor 2 family protein [Bacteroidota bacterium]